MPEKIRLGWDKFMKINFNYLHSIFDGNITDICSECQGLCEKTQLGIFLPNEVDYISTKMGIKKEEFIKKFCTVIKIKTHHIYLLKVPNCPFLNSEYHCILEDYNCKPITCKLYPFWLGLDDGTPSLMLDSNLCPMAEKIPSNFRKIAKMVGDYVIPRIPKYWLKFESTQDDFMFCYDKLEILKDKKIIKTKDLLECRMLNKA